MPFRLTNAPSTFQATMNQVFLPYLRKFVIIFFNDILVYSVSISEHLQHLRIVLQTLLENQLFAELSKCQFCQESIEYLGHIVSVSGVQPDPKKIQTMLEWSTELWK